MHDKQIKHMVDRFLGWRLPEDFRPDAGISFNPEFNVEYMATLGKPPMRHEPTGTNLLTATQAEAMVRHMVEGLPPWALTEERREFAWLIEAPGPNYLATRDVGGARFHWTADHDKALRFASRVQADGVMMAVRALDPALFAFAANLGDARLVEHMWIDLGRPVPRHGSGGGEVVSDGAGRDPRPLSDAPSNGMNPETPDPEAER